MAGARADSFVRLNLQAQPAIIHPTRTPFWPADMPTVV